MITDSNDTETRIRELEQDLKNRESEIKSLQERLKNNEEMLQDAICEKNQVKIQLQEYDLQLTDEKLKQLQNLQEKYNKKTHRVQVTKKQLDDARIEIRDLNEVIDDLANRGLMDHILGRYPESFQVYREDKL